MLCGFQIDCRKSVSLFCCCMQDVDADIQNSLVALSYNFIDRVFLIIQYTQNISVLPLSKWILQVWFGLALCTYLICECSWVN